MARMALMWCGVTGKAQFALVALVACACLAQAQASPQSDLFSLEKRGQQRSNAGQYCGSRLSEALKLLCQGNYNSYFKSKKASPEEYWAPPVQLPFRERLRAAAFLETRSRFTRGVFDECCSKSCTVDELMTYCGVGARSN